ASAGFYVRSLAHDLGQKLGCGAHLESLRRVQAGPFMEQDSVMLSALEREGADATRRILPLEQLLPDIPAVALNERDSERVRHGADVPSDGAAVGAATTRRRLFDPTGRLLAIGEVRPGA